MSPITGVSSSADGQLFASISEDGSAKVFDVLNFGAQVAHIYLSWRLLVNRHDKHDKARIYPSCVLLGT